MVKLKLDQALTASPGLPAAPCAPGSPYREAREGGLGLQVNRSDIKLATKSNLFI